MSGIEEERAREWRKKRTQVSKSKTIRASKRSNEWVNEIENERESEQKITAKARANATCPLNTYTYK